MPEATSHPVDRAITDLVSLFQTELADVRFPDADAATLDAAMAAVASQADAVHQLWTAHQDAMAVLRERQHALRDHARKALAYARIYAAGNAELTRRLEAFSLDDQTPASASKRRGRKRKTKTATPQLDLDDAPNEPTAAPTQQASAPSTADAA